MAIKKELVDELLKDVDPKQVFASEGLMAELKKALAELTCRISSVHRLLGHGFIRALC